MLRFDIRQATISRAVVLLFHGANTMRVLFVSCAAKSTAPVKAHRLKIAWRGRLRTRPETIAKSHQGFAEAAHVNAHCAAVFFLLMTGISIPRRQKFSPDFRNGHINDAATGLQFFRRQLP
ncbi:hypothetical protein D3C72_2163410 [compost metagenome]